MSTTSGFDRGFSPREGPSSVLSEGTMRSIPPEWPTLWARCWSRIRTWRVPPRWSPCYWCNEARASGALAACEAHLSFEPGRSVPLEAYLYGRVVASV
jgi:hypothetical protein